MYIKLILIFFCLISLSKQHPGGHAGGEAREEIGKLKEGEEKDERGKNDTEKEKSKVKYSSADDNIQILDYRSLSPTVYSSNKLTLVQFYAHWCPSCERFAPYFRIVAKKVKRWRNMIRIGVIDCGLEQNNPACDDHGVTYVPTFKLYYAESKEQGFETGDDTFTVDDFIHDIINFVGEHPKKPKAWPVVKPLGVSVEKLIELNRRARYILLIFEEDNSYLGRKFILDFAKFALKFCIRRVNQATNPSLFTQLKVDETDMPVFLLIQKMDSGELKYFKFDQVVKNLQTTKEENKIEEYEEESDKKQSLRYTYGVKITKFIRYTPFDSHIDLNEL